jgi:hypothetical protein
LLRMGQGLSGEAFDRLDGLLAAIFQSLLRQRAGGPAAGRDRRCPWPVPHPGLPDRPGRGRALDPATGQGQGCHLALGADKQLRDALTDFAGDSLRASPWAADLYDEAIARGADHYDGTARKGFHLPPTTTVLRGAPRGRSPRAPTSPSDTTPALPVNPSWAGGRGTCSPHLRPTARVPSGGVDRQPPRPWSLPPAVEGGTTPSTRNQPEGASR